MVQKTGTILQTNFMTNIHCFGDSFTAGNEIVDYKYFENYPKFLNFDNWSKQKDSKKVRPLLDSLNSNKMNALLKEEKTKSYPGLLSANNHSVGGSSLQSIARKVIEYLENTQNKKNIILLQPTGFERWCDFVDGKWQDFISDVPSYQYQDYFKFKVSQSTELSNLILWYNTFLPLVAYIQNHKKTADWWIIDNGIFNQIKNLVLQKKFKVPYIIRSLSNLKEKTINFPQVDDTETNYYCPGGHVNDKAHFVLANKIRKKLEQHYKKIL